MLLLTVLLSLITYIKKDDNKSVYYIRLFKFTKWFIYLQAVLGIILLFTSQLVSYNSGFIKDKGFRFYSLEHPLMMLIAVGIIAIGLYKSERKTNTTQKNKSILIYYTVALIIILGMIPWKAALA
jgi:hypothetical protein